MHIVVNEFSFTAQAKHRQYATDLMRKLMKTLQALELRRCGDPIHAHSLLWQQRVSPEQTLQEWIAGPYERELQPIRLLLSKLLTNGPHIDIRLADINHDCEIEQENERISVKGSGIAGAAWLKACLVGLDECDSFPDCTIEVHYREGDSKFEKLNIEHICGLEGTKRVVRIFESHPKHDQDFPTYGVRGTPMDLKVDEATRLLNSGEELVENDRRVYACHRQRIYVFHPHRQQQNLYHGFPVESDELMRHNIHAYNAARRKGWLR